MHHHQGTHSGSSSLSIEGCLACACTSPAPLYTNSPPKPTKVMRVTIVMETTTMMMLMSLMLMLLLMALINFNLTKTLQELRSPTLISGSAYHPPGGATSSSSLYKSSLVAPLQLAVQVHPSINCLWWRHFNLKFKFILV